MRLLVVTKIFPNARAPEAAPYTMRQCRSLSKLCDVSVLATLPWFPGDSWLARARGGQSPSDGIPERETLHGLELRHPRFLYVPALPGLSAAAYAASLAPVIRQYRGKVDAILSTWAYPDGVASVLLGRMLGVKTVVQVIGSDINVLSKLTTPGWQLGWGLSKAAGVIAVSRPLANRCIELGAAPETVRVVWTGVDKGVFCIRDKAEARRELGIPDDAQLLVFVGRLVVEKGLRELMQAFAALAERYPRLRLALIGDGPFEAEGKTFAEAHGERLHFAGVLKPPQVARWLHASDGLVLPSYAEGTPNVVLEAIACGRRVVATSVGGLVDCVPPLAGKLVPPADAVELGRAMSELLETPYDPVQVASSLDLFDWDENARRVFALLEEVTA